jgi:DNA-binding NtrC family response regulator
MSKKSILVVEDNVLVGMSVRDILTEDGYEVRVCTEGAGAESALAEDSFSVALLDLMLPDANGLELLERWQKAYPQMRVIIVTAYGDIAKAVECIKAGAYEFLAKPVERVLLKKTVANAVEQLNLTRQLTVLTELSKRDQTALRLGDVVGQGKALRRTMELARLVAESDFSCLFIRGESGTGKGLFARTIHNIGRRASKPFVEVNCSALPATLIESELFGHKKGAFTDAKEDRVGLFELADEGTLFLDEIGDMDISLQAKLLKVMEDQRFRRIGGTKDISVDVAIVAATNQRIEQLVEDGRFREDLYYRLNVIPLDLPPLRDHIEDVGLLLDHFVKFFAKKFGKRIQGFSPEAMAMLASYSWPGNVRELRNVVERGCLLTQGEVISQDHLLFPRQGQNPTLGQAPTADPADLLDSLPVLSLADAEKMAIQRAMKASEGNRNQAARLLGVHRTTLYKKLAEYALE